MTLDLSSAGNKLVLITETHRGMFPDELIGTGERGPCFDFMTNFRKSHLMGYVKVIAENDFPEAAFGIGEKATGYNEDEGYEFHVPDCYAFYVGDCGNEVLQRFHKLLNEEIYDPAYRETQPWVVREQYRG